VLVTTPAFIVARSSRSATLPTLKHVLLVGGDHREHVEGTVDFDDVLSAASPEFEIPCTDPEDMALLHFTSGTTGMPKGAVHVHDAVVAIHATGTSALDHCTTTTSTGARRTLDG
jgi:acetyl-CoA synthetase